MALKGTLSELGIVDLIQFPHPGRKSGELLIDKGDQQARLFYDKGALVHATLGDVTGMDALVRVIDWQQGSFQFDTDVTPPQTTIDLDLHRAVMQALKLHDELKADGLRRKTGKDEPSGNEEAIRGRLQEFVSSNDFASYACLVVPDGSVLAAAEGPDGTPAGIEALVASLNGLVQSYPRETLRRLILDDDLGTVVLARVGNGASVIVIARKGAPLGAVSMNVGRLAAGLE